MRWVVGVIPITFDAVPCEADTATFEAAGETDQSWLVPSGVTTIDVVVLGGGYFGGRVTATAVPVTPGETLTIRVGLAATGQTGGWPNGGMGGTGPGGVYGMGGCGSTSILRAGTPIVIAGGEGGAYDATPSNIGGTTGGLGSQGGTGSSSTYGVTAGSPNGMPSDAGTWGGGGGTQSTGGLAGVEDLVSGTGTFPPTAETTPATAGGGPSTGLGGDGNVHTLVNSSTGAPIDSAAGGGGGGYYGGGGGSTRAFFGARHGYGGGGGSCYVGSLSATIATSFDGPDGKVVIDFCVPVIPEEPSECIPGVMGSGLWTPTTDQTGQDALLVYNVDAYEVTDDSYSSLQWPGTITGSQSIEVTVTNFMYDEGDHDPGSVDYVDLYVRKDGVRAFPALNVGLEVELGRHEGGDFYLTVTGWGVVYVAGGGSGDYYTYFESLTGLAHLTEFTFRVESDVDGTFRVYVDDALIFTDVQPGVFVGPSNVGVAMVSDSLPTDSPRITDICIIGDAVYGFGDFSDDWADAPEFDIMVDGSLFGANEFATSEGADDRPDEDVYGVDTTAHTLWCKFTPTADGLVTLDTLGSDFDTVLGIYTGASLAGLTIINENDDGPGFSGGDAYLSEVVAAVTNGTTYYVVVSGYGGAFGTVVLNHVFV